MRAPDDDTNFTGLTRRSLIARGLGAVAAAGAAPVIGATGASARTRNRPWFAPGRDLSEPLPFQREALRVLGRDSIRQPLSLANPAIPEGTDTLPAIEHVVVLMMENHSYDNFAGMLGRGPHRKKGQKPRGDGWPIGRDGIPTTTNPYANGTLLRAFHMPTTCQLGGKPSQDWLASHVQYSGGTNQGFVISGSGPVSMGYWDQRDLPFTYDLFYRFPIGDRYFCSLLGQTDPNRRYLIAATSMGMTDDIPLPSQDIALALPPPNGTIFQLLDGAHITWKEYFVEYPNVTSATEELYPVNDEPLEISRGHPFSAFLSDVAAGTLPSVSLVDPNFSTQSQENPQNIVVGEGFLASVVNAIGKSPKWEQTLLIINYDEHGGYYDHVPPPAALAPDDVQPITVSGQPAYDGFHRYGFRVPACVVGPYAKKNYVSHLVYDHASVLAFIERKWNLKALTYRDANANDLTDFIDIGAMTAGNVIFPELPALAAPGDTAAALACSKSGPGTVPPPVTPTTAKPKPKPHKKKADRPTGRGRAINHRR